MNFKPILLLFIFPFILYGCAVRSVYIPVSQNVPLFDTSTCLKSGAYISTNHIELQTACNPGRHLAIAGNINFGSGLSVYDAAVATYGCSKSGRWRYELFGGYGYTTNTSYQQNALSLFNSKYIDYRVNSVYHKFYIQPAIGLVGRIKMYKINYSFSLSSRLSFNQFNSFIYQEIDKEQTSDPDHPVYIVNRDYQNKRLFLFEPCFTNKVGIKDVYAILQVQAMIPYSNDIDLHYTKFSQGILLSIGIQYDLKFKKR